MVAVVTGGGWRGLGLYAIFFLPFNVGIFPLSGTGRVVYLAILAIFYLLVAYVVQRRKRRHNASQPLGRGQVGPHE